MELIEEIRASSMVVNSYRYVVKQFLSLLLLYLGIFPNIAKAYTNFEYPLSREQFREIKQQLFNKVGKNYSEIFSDELPKRPSIVIKDQSCYSDLQSSDLEDLDDYTHLPFVTMDNEDSMDLDQAFYVEEQEDFFILYYAIADASYFLDHYPNKTTNASRRIFTFYLYFENIPLFDRSLSEDICSLVPQKIRRALILKVKVSKTKALLTPDKIEFYHGKIVSCQKLHFSLVQDFFDHPQNSKITDSNVQESLRRFRNLGRLLRKNHRERIIAQRGKIRQRISKELKISYCNNHLVIEDKEDSEVELLNSEISILANQAAGIFIKENNYFSSIHRYHVGEDKGAIYSKDQEGHYDLAIENYDQFTAPMRRYTDIINHRFLLSIIYNSSKTLPSNQEIESAIKQANIMELFDKSLAREQSKILINYLANLDNPLTFYVNYRRNKKNSLEIDRNQSPAILLILKKKIDLSHLFFSPLIKKFLVKVQLGVNKETGDYFLKAISHDQQKI